jgi:hypothetical protein
MSDTSTEHRDTPNDPTRDGASPAPDDYASSVPPPQFSGHDQPRLIEGITFAAVTARTR